MTHTTSQVDSARIEDRHDDDIYTVKAGNGLKLDVHASTLTSEEIQNLLSGDAVYIGRTAFYVTSR